MIHLIADSLRNAILVTGLVVIMMLMIEYVNVTSNGRWLGFLGKSSFGQVVLGALLGLVPGCIGGFATVSLYSHGLLSFGALIAMMIASSGDEAFVMMAMVPKTAVILFIVLFLIAIVVGFIIDKLPLAHKKVNASCGGEYELHTEDFHSHHHHSHAEKGHKIEWQRVVMLVGIAAFIVALVLGLLEHEHEGEDVAEMAHTALPGIFDEYWLNLLFAALACFALWFTARCDSHFLKEHLWNHVVKQHLPGIFCWTFSVLLLIAFALSYLDIESWISTNIPLVILLAILVGIIPES
ncbi:MAG: arsenic efflux protein, partial [Bacteroidales bacterium]|nr:arsenic efflux protein [Bacteroidales bacterium]